MKRSLPRLRRIDLPDYVNRQAIRRWRQAGCRAEWHTPPVCGDYLTFRAEGPGGGWQGLVEAREWLAGLLPELSALLRTPSSIESIAELFQALARPLEAGVEELGYERLSSVAIGTARDQPLPRITTAWGSLWLLRLPERALPPQSVPYSPWLQCLPHCLRATLGDSQLSPAVLSALATGDVLRISRLTRHWLLAGQQVGEFTLIEQGLQMTLSPETPTTEPCDALGNLPVRLEFVLHEQCISLAELAALIEGQVLALPPSALGNIEIRANGRRLAHGELVQLGESLGVELQQIHRELVDGQ